VYVFLAVGAGGNKVHRKSARRQPLHRKDRFTAMLPRFNGIENAVDMPFQFRVE
jgi:hypothetical protein